MVVSSGRSFETVSMERSDPGPANGPIVRSLLLPPDDGNAAQPLSLGEGSTVPVAGAQDVPGEVGAIEAAARELGIGKPTELLVHGRRIVVVGAGPEPGASRARKRRYRPCLDDARPMTTSVR